MIDNATLLIGIAFSSASLMIALLIGWLNSRHERYLVHGAAGIGLIVVAVAIMGFRNGRYELVHTLLPFTLILTGLSLVYSGSRLFRNPSAILTPAIVVGAVSVPAMAAPFLLGYSGLGTIALNVFAGLFMVLCAREYWVSRKEGVVAMSTNAFIYTLTAISFFSCAAVLTIEQDWVLTSPADNWAEDFNSIMTLVGLTGIGAITLTLHHARAARRHRLEANTDELTGVLNRRALFQRFRDNDVVPGLAVIMFDLDHFKQINDRKGHAYGDMVLQRFADVLLGELGHTDTIARVGGEEFCAVLPGRDWEAARQLAERVRKALADLRLSIGNQDEVATVSAGMATGGAEEHFGSLLSRADAALYKAKESGRNQVHVAPVRLVA
ncbi:GGDEF domain-containing protein [Devosia sediminis]|uniref:diguanylate cyclase n=1 Tax=Devosia sediminis TaxID=2798801 RepID=A0A934MJ15_9HYPH|nr:GGDEF domain-containing protein [Devosia sediminis]MBJ3783573.1 GGDEF domain-containing protein [Devosia sediminis]